MDIFKLRQGEHESTKLTHVNFHIATSKKYPWYQERNGKTMHYAVCPECENPLNVVNLDIDSKVDAEGRAMPLYAKHAITSIEGIAKYDEEAYNECSLSNPRSFNGVQKERKLGKVADDILHQLKEHADAVHYMLEHFLKLHVPEALFQSLLTSFRKQHGQLYRSVTTSNLPYALLYMSGNQSTYRCRVRKGSPFEEALARSEYFALRDGSIIYSDKGRTIKPNPKLRFFFTDHSIRKTGTGFEQTMMLIVEEEIGEAKKQIYRQPLSLDISYYRNLVDKRARLRQIARTTLM